MTPPLLSDFAVCLLSEQNQTFGCCPEGVWMCWANSNPLCLNYFPPWTRWCPTPLTPAVPLSPLCPHLSGLRNPAWCLPGLPSSSWLPRQCWFSSKARGGFASTHPVLRTHQAHHSSHLLSGFAGDEQNFPDCCLLQECCLLIIINDSLRLLLLPILINWVIATISLGGLWGWHVQKKQAWLSIWKKDKRELTPCSLGSTKQQR